MKLISHPNIVQMKETYESDNNMYIVMEQINGGELFEHIHTYDMDEKEIATIMFQLLQAIDYLHDCGIIHRDLKPENILVAKNQSNDEIISVKVADFGLSKFIVPNELMLESCGTPAYVAPEVLQMKGYGKQVDIWSAGCCFAEILK